MDVGFDDRQYVRVPADLRPDCRLLFEDLNIHVLIVRQFEGKARRGNSGALFRQPDDAEAAATNLSDQRVRTDLGLRLRHCRLTRKDGSRKLSDLQSSYSFQL